MNRSSKGKSQAALLDESLQKHEYVESRFDDIKEARLKGYSWAEIAAVIGWPDESVKNKGNSIRMYFLRIEYHRLPRWEQPLPTHVGRFRKKSHFGPGNGTPREEAVPWYGSI